MPDGMNLAGVGQALDVSLPTIISEFMLLRDVTGVFRSCADPQTLKKHSGVSWIRNNYGRAVAYHLDEAADMNQAQSLSDLATVITPAEAGAQITLPGSTLRRVADPTLESRVAQMLNNAYDLLEDQDGAAQMSSWTSQLGSTVILGIGNVAAAAARLGVGNSATAPEPAPLPWYYIGHDYTLNALAGRILVMTDVPTGTTAFSGLTGTGITLGAGHDESEGSMSAQLQRDGIGKLTRLLGMTIKKDANIPVASNVAIGGAFSEAGFLYVNEVEPHLVPDRSDASMRDAVELNIWGSFKYGLYRPGNYGLSMSFDATTPT